MPRMKCIHERVSVMNEKDMVLNKPEVVRNSGFRLFGKPYLVQVSPEFPSVMMEVLAGKVIVVGENDHWRDPYGGVVTASDVLLVPCNHNDKIFGIDNLPKEYREGVYQINRMWLTKITSDGSSHVNQ